ncbi:MAG: penicillin-binding transpeptidase domain-containing protein, partial [Bacillota bacterium]|nr:penicillin-binding transpeptidase domain-containing protein [Bacillota bacterium]
VHGKPLPYGIHERREPRHGADVVLTLHPQFQYFVEQRLEEAVHETGAKSAAAVLIDVNSGEVYAMANSPTFDLNRPFDLDDAVLPDNWDQLSDQEQTDYYFTRVWNNPIVSNIYEPGSTMKTLISAIAVNEGLVNLNSSFYCEGSTRVTGEQLRCFSYPVGHGHQDLTTAFVNSCNVAYIDIGQRIGKERLYQYFDRVGLFSQSGVDLPAESMPNYLDVGGLRDVELATMSYGHTIGVNMLQVVSALSSTVNGGYRVHPHFLKEIRYPDGRSEYPPLPNRERVFERETVETVKSMLRAMANHLNPTLEVEGVALGGKTGTSVKFVDGEYRDDQVISSFVVFAPIDQPKYALLILLDEPDIRTHGHRVAVQFADRILEDLFRYEALSAASTDRETVIVPNVVGMTLAEARETMKASGLRLSADMEQQLDTRVVEEQFPIAGVPVPEGALIILKLKEGL